MPCGYVQRRAITRTQLAHNDTTIDKRLYGSRACSSEPTQVGRMDPLKRCTGLKEHQRTASIVTMTNLQRNAKRGPPKHINGSKIRLASEQQRKHVVVAALGGNMTRRPASLVSFVHSRIGSQENVDNVFLAKFGRANQRRPKVTRQVHVDINRTTQYQRLDH